MNFELDDEQFMLREQLSAFFERNCDRDTLRRVVDSGAAYDASLLSSLVQLGVLGAAIPESFGGSGFSHVELCVLAEQLGRSLAPVPVTSTIFLVAEALMIAGSERQKKHWLPKLASGEVIAALAVGEKARPMDPWAPRARCSRDRLSGCKAPVVDGSVADLYLVLALDDDGGEQAVSLFLVPSGETVRRDPVETIDLLRQSAHVTFDDAPAERLGSPGTGIEIANQLMDHAAVLVAFEQVGGADRCLEMACGYSRERTAFGRQIGSFQAVKHMLADMYVATELARSNAYHGAWALAGDPPSLSLAAAAARLSASKAYLLCAQNGLHIHGGLGFTWEADCHLHLRRANALALLLGSQARWERKLVSSLSKVDPALLPS